MWNRRMHVSLKVFDFIKLSDSLWIEKKNIITALFLPEETALAFVQLQEGSKGVT